MGLCAEVRGVTQPETRKRRSKENARRDAAQLNEGVDIREKFFIRRSEW